MYKSFLIVVFGTSLVLGQAAPEPQAPSAPTPQTPLAPTPQRGAPMAGPETPAEVPPDAAVITLHGLCPDNSAAPKSPTCETIVTRAQFEKLADALGPNMEPQAKQKLASDYARMLVIDAEARKRGLENTPHYDELLSFLKKQLLAQELFRQLQEKAKPSDADVQKYYDEHKSDYEELTLNRLFIPRNRPDEVRALKKPAGAKTAPATHKTPTDADLQAQGEKLRARLQAGDSFEKLEKEVYTSAGFKTPPPPTSIPNWRRSAVPPSEQELFDLKPKEISKVMVEPAGAYIYEVVDRKEIPLSEVKPQIVATLTNEQLRKDMDSLMADVKPEANQAYFRALAAQGPEGRVPPPQIGPSEPAPKPQVNTSKPAPKVSPATQAKPK